MGYGIMALLGLGIPGIIIFIAGCILFTYLQEKNKDK